MALAARPSALACRLSAPLRARGATRAARRARRAPSRAQGATQGAAHEPGASSLAALSSRTRELVSNVLPYWTLIVASSALVHPPLMAWIGKEYWSTALSAIMLAVGINLRFEDFATIPWRTVGLGLLISTVVRPAVALAVVAGFGVPPAAAAGVLMLACVPVSTLCNFAAVVCGGAVPVSVMLVAISTVLSVGLTPLLAENLVGVSFHLDTMAMAMTVKDVVLLPVLFGLLMNQYLPAVASRLKVALPFLGLAGATVCSGAPVATHAAAITSAAGVAVLPPVLVLHLGTLVGCYYAARAGARMSIPESRTVGLAGSMLSSLLATLLVSRHLPDPASVVPCAISIIMMCSVGLITAAVWAQLDKRK